MLIQHRRIGAASLQGRAGRAVRSYRISPSILPDFSYGKNPVYRGKKSVPPGKKHVKNTCFFTRQTAPKRHSSLFLRTFFLCRNKHVPFPPPARPGPVPHPGPARHPDPAQRSCNCDRIFFRLSTVFFAGHTGFFPR